MRNEVVNHSSRVSAAENFAMVGEKDIHESELVNHNAHDNVSGHNRNVAGLRATTNSEVGNLGGYLVNESAAAAVYSGTATLTSETQRTLAPPKDMGGFRAMLLLVSLRWRMIRSPALRVLFIGVVGLFLLGLYSSVSIGYLVQVAAQEGTDTAQTIYATAWINSLNSGYMASIGALAIGGAVLVAFFAPFTGTSTTALVTADDLLGVRPPKIHRFWGALLINGGSGIGLLQFITLTAVASLITLDGDKLWALIFTWTLWFVLICINTTLGFTLEWFHRRWGPSHRRIIGFVGGGIVAAAILLDDKRGTDLFGLAEWYVYGLRLSVEQFNMTSVWLVIGLIFISAIIIAWGLRMTSIAFSLPERSSNRGGLHKTRKMGESPWAASAIILWRSLSRTKEVRRPLLAIVLLGVPVAAFTQLDQTLTIAFTMTVPLAVSLSCGVNVFGVIGQGMSWLSSQPKIIHHLLPLTMMIQFVLSVALIGMFWGVGFLAGRATVEAGKPLLIGAVVAGISTTVISALLASFHPVRAPLQTRGDTLVPPVTAIGYLILLITFGCVPSILIAQEATPETQNLFAGAAVLASFAIATVVLIAWSSPRIRANVTAKVAVE